MSAPLMGADGNINLGVDPAAFTRQQGLDPNNPHVIASQFAQVAQPAPTSLGAPPAGQPPVPDPAAAPVTPGDPAIGGDQPAPAADPDDKDLVTTSAGLAAMFDDTTPEQLFDAITHTIGDRDYSLAEIVEGFRAQPDAVQVVAQRDGLEAEFAQRTQAQRMAHDGAMQSVAQLHTDLSTRIAEDEGHERLAQLLSSDPAAYQAEITKINNRKATLSNAQAELDRQKSSAQRTQEAEFETFRNGENVKLQRLFPEWSDVKAGPAVKAKLSNYARSIGFTDAELANIVDSRFLLVLRDAALGSEAKTAGLKTIKAAKDKKLPAPAGKPGARVDAPGQNEIDNNSRAAKFDKLKQSGRVSDAAALFSELV